jgi:hypothetical protein
MSPTIIEIKPHRRGWKVFEAPGVEPVFAAKDQASVCLRDYVEWLTEALKRASSDSPPGVD